MPAEQSLAVIQGGCAPSPFRSAPWFILRNRAIKSNGNALILSAIWSASQAGGPTTRRSPSLGISPRISRITNIEIARRAGLKISPEAVRRHLVSLEQLGLIKRHGKACNRTIEVTISPRPDEDPRGLIIDEDTLTSNQSPTQKLL